MGRRRPPRGRSISALAIAWFHFSVPVSCAPPAFDASVRNAGTPGGAGAAAAEERPFAALTEVSIKESAWHLNGKITYPGARAEGLLLNARMANATFEDTNPATRPAGFDPEKNVEAFLAKLPDYVAHGVLGFTLSLQGAHPGYKGAVCSAFERDGGLRPDYLRRVARVVEACDRLGAVVIVTCFDAEQDQILEDAAAVKNAVVQAAGWIRRRGYKNVCLEIAHEHASKGYDHETIRDPSGVRDLIRLAHQAAPGLLVSSSGMGGGRAAHAIAVEGDFVLLHFGDVPIDQILERVASADKVSKPIVCSEDRRTGEEGAKALETSVNAWCSWGFSNAAKNQTYPFRFEGAADDPVVYAKFKELANP